MYFYLFFLFCFVILFCKSEVDLCRRHFACETPINPIQSTHSITYIQLIHRLNTIQATIVLPKIVVFTRGPNLGAIYLIWPEINAFHLYIQFIRDCIRITNNQGLVLSENNNNNKKKIIEKKTNPIKRI